MSRATDDDATPTPTIGSSDVPVILGLNPYRTVWEVWPRLVGLRQRYDASDGTPATRRGHRLEEPVALWWALEQGLDLIECPKVPEPPLVGPEPWMHDRPDFYGLPGRGRLVSAAAEHADRVLEVKTARWRDQWEDGPPDYVLAQALWHLACTTVDTCDIVLYVTGRDELAGWAQERRDDLITRLVRTVRDWYERHVLEQVPPPLDGSAASVRWAGACYPYAAPDTTGMSKAAAARARPMLEASPADLALHADLRRVTAELAALNEEQNRLKARLMERIGGAYGLQSGPVKLAIWPESKGRESVRVNELRAFAEGLSEPHRTEALNLIRAGQPYRMLRTYDLTTKEQ